MFREYTNQLKKYNFIQSLQQGKYIDAKDQGKWKVGIIKSFRKIGHKHTVQIQFDGYPSKYNQIYDIPSYNNSLAPFRKYSLPYTGRVSDIRRQQPTKSLQAYLKSINRIISDLQKDSNKDKQTISLNSQFINQFIRGQLFIYIDYIMTKSPSKYQTKYSFQDYLKVLMAYLELFDKVLEKVFDFLKEMDKEKQINLDQNYVYVFHKMALLYSVTEFAFNCNSMIQKKQQRVTFHSSFSGPVQQIYNIFLQKIKAMNLYQKCQKLLNYKFSNNKTLPWSIKKQIFILMKTLNPEQEFQNPKQHKQIIQVIEFLPYFVKKGVFLQQQGDKKYLDLIFNLVIKGNFQGKLIGLNQIKKRISSSAYYSYTSSYSKKQAIIIDQMKQKNLIEFFLNNNNFNSQLFKRSLIIFQYGYKHNLFTRDHFSQIFKLHKDKHQLQLMNFYNSLAQFGMFLNQKDSQQFFKFMIQSLPFQENFIELVKNFTIIVIDKNSLYKKHFMRNQQQGFGLIYFWELISKQVKINKQLMLKVIQAFATLLNNIYYSKHADKFIIQSIKAIQQLKNSEYFLKVIHQSLKLCKGSRINKIIEDAQKQVDIIQAAMNVLKQQQNTLSKSGFQNLFEFLQEVNSVSKKGLTFNDILFMWKLDKTKCRTYLLKFFRKYKIKGDGQDKSHQKVINKTLQLSLIENLIKNIFQDDTFMEDYKKVDQQHYQAIDQLIIVFLHHKGIIEYNYKHTIRYKKNMYFLEEDKKFLGMKFYIKCIQNCENQQVSIKATKRLIQIFLRPDVDSFDKNYTQIKVKNWLKISKIFNQLKNNKLRSFKIQQEQIKGRMKSLNILDPDPIQYIVRLQGQKKVKTISVPRYTSLWKFRLQLNQIFELKDTNFQIYLTQNKITTNLQREQDFSVLLIHTSRDKNAINVLVTPSNQPHPHFQAIRKFKELFSQNFAQSLYNNLSSKGQLEAQQSLQILQKIPFLSSLQKSIKKLDFKNWSQIIDGQNMKKIQYQMQIIRQARNMQWIIRFNQKSGSKHLIQVILNNLNKNCFKQLNLCLNILLQALRFQKDKLSIKQQIIKQLLYLSKQKSQQYQLFLLTVFTIIKQISKKIKLSTIFDKQNIGYILQVVIFTDKKTKISQQLIQICVYHDLFPQLTKIFKKYLNINFLQEKMYKCRSLFQTISYLIQRGILHQIASPLQSIILQIRNSNICQKSQNQTNYLLYGFILCIYQFLKVHNRINQILLEDQESFSNFLIKQCLFHSQNIALSKFKSKELRSQAFNLLKYIQSTYKKNNTINEILIPLMSKGAWRKQFQWNIQPVQIINKKYTGIKNLAATCYINSLLQQLFYIKQFSNQLMQIDSDSIQDKQNIVRQIQNIFGFLKFSQNPSYTTLSLCRNFILDGQPIDPRIQTDVDEFFHALMDKLQTNLNKINKKQIINDIFRGQFSNLIIGQECPHVSQRIQHFLSIRLEIKNKKTLYQAFQEFIKGQMLEGQNLYFCEKCDKKVKALKRVCLKDLPNVLIITLKRFQFNFDTMQKFKLNSYCSFPQNINLLPYTKQGIQQAQQNNTVDSQSKSSVLNNHQNYEYKLKGVIIHYGISQAGHYTSYVRTDDKKQWNYFDDQKISQFNLNNLQKQCFGGIQQNPFGDDQQKKKNAYLLIYEKVKTQNTQKILQKQNQDQEQALKKTKVYSLVQQDNLKNKSVNVLFQSNIQNYIYNSSEQNATIFLIYYHNVFLRNAKKYDKYNQFYQKAIQLLSNKQISKWYLSQINQSFLLQFVIHGDYQAKHIVTSLICHSMRKVYDKQFILQCIGLLYTKNIIPFVKIFSEASFIPEYAKQLSAHNLGDVILNLIKGKQIKQNNIISKVTVRKQILAFGLAASGFIQTKKYDPKDLFRAIQGMKVNLTFNEIKSFAQEIRNPRTQKSLAMITARKFKDLDSLTQLIENNLANELINYQISRCGQEYYYNFLLLVIQEILKIKDSDQQRRCILLTKMYFDAIKQSLNGFKSQLMLITYLFKIWLINPMFRQTFLYLINQDKQSKKIILQLKQWLKQSQSLISNINNQKWSWWRKYKKNYQGLNQHQVDIQIRLPIKQSLSLLNSIIEKQNLQVRSQYSQPGDLGYILDRNWDPQHLKVIRKIGMLVEVEDNQGNKRFVSQDDVIKKFI